MVVETHSLEELLMYKVLPSDCVYIGAPSVISQIVGHIPHPSPSRFPSFHPSPSILLPLANGHTYLFSELLPWKPPLQARMVRQSGAVCIHCEMLAHMQCDLFTISLRTGTPILQIFAEVTTTSTSFHSSEATSHADQHKPLQEDDHFGLLSRTIPEVEDIPSHLLLTDETFSLHVANYRKTAVVFYLKCKIP